MHTGSADPLSLQGVIPPTITVFDDDEEVDYERTAAHARFDCWGNDCFRLRMVWTPTLREVERQRSADAA